MLPLIAVLITCHNRKEKTLSCLQALFNQKDLGKEFILDVFLVDDGSTDGTSELITTQFPEVNIIQGTGNLYWNRGMHLAWQTAADTKDFDYYLWLNDDTFLVENAFEVLLKEKFPHAIVCGSTKSKVNNIATYGVYVTKPKTLLIPNGKFKEGDYCNGNCVLIPRSIFNKIGNLDPFFQHALGDFDYSLRARKKEYNIILLQNNTCNASIYEKNKDVIEKYKYNNNYIIIDINENIYKDFENTYEKKLLA
jgi:GT2 family glycosyltransferase